MAGEEIQNLLKSGIQAAKNGNKDIARGIFEEVLRLDSQNEVAWLWLASVQPSRADRAAALRRVLQINPNNERAQQALQKLEGETTQKSEKAASTPPPPPESPKPQPAPPAPEAPPIRPRPTTARGGGLNNILFYGGIVLGLLLIVTAIALLVLDAQVDEETPAPVVAVDTPTEPLPPAGTLPPAATATRFVVTVQPGLAGSRADLPPSWTPSPTNTAFPSPSPAPPLPEPDTLRLVFVSAPDPAAPSILETMLGSGDDRTSVTVQFDAAQINIQGQATATPLPQDVSRDELRTPEGAPPATPDATEAVAPDITATVEPTLFADLALLDPVYSPDGAELVFAAQIAPEVQELFLLRVASGNVRQLTTFGARFTNEPDFSPDGAQIVFASNQAGGNVDDRFDIFRLDLDSGELENLTGGLGQNRHPAYAPNGMQISFASDRDTPGEFEIWAMDLDTRAVSQLTDAANASFAPSYAPDSMRIAFISNRGGDNDLYIMNADGTSEQLVSLNDNNAEDRAPAWSPDGAWIALASTRDNQRNPQIWLVRPDGTDWRQLTNGPGPHQDPAWYPIVTE